MKRRFVLACVLVALPVGGCASTASTEPDAEARAWRPIFQGVAYRRIAVDQPRPLRVHALRIDLRAPGVSLVVTPDNGEAPLDTDGRTTASFLQRFDVQAAVNASPFHPVVLWPAPQDVRGLSISGGNAYSLAEGSFHAALIGPGNRLRLTGPPFDLDGVEHAAGGFGMVLRDGAVVGRDDARHPRTAIGLSADRRWCWLVAIDGRQPGYSEGVSTAELGTWMRRLGCAEALNLDGGGSTAMVIEDPSGGPRTLNRPINAGIPGLQRIVANHIGVRARPLR